jgi:hypothetical protein
MSKRLITVLVLAFTLVPLAASADDTTATDPAAASASAAGLGPAATGGNSGGSNADASSLQPAGGSPLQPTNTDASGLPTSSANALQAPTTPADTLRVIQGDADGPTHDTADTTAGNWDWLWLSLAFGGLVAGAVFFLRTNPQLTARFRRRLALVQAPERPRKSRKKRRRH